MKLSFEVATHPEAMAMLTAAANANTLTLPSRQAGDLTSGHSSS
jgi:hypothetical protein